MPPTRIFSCESFQRPLTSNLLCKSSSFRLPLRPSYTPPGTQAATSSQTRTFTTSPSLHNYLVPRRNVREFKTRKGRPHVPTGGSVRGTTVVWGQYGLRMRSHDQRISAAQLKIGEEVIRRRLRGEHYRLFTRICCNVAVYTKGNESRMGTGKGSFDYWAARVGPNKVVFELSGGGHEQVVRDAFRLASNKLPGQWEFIKKGDPPVMGTTKVTGEVTEESLRRPRKKLPVEATASRIPAASDTATTATA